MSAEETKPEAIGDKEKGANEQQIDGNKTTEDTLDKAAAPSCTKASDNQGSDAASTDGVPRAEEEKPKQHESGNEGKTDSSSQARPEMAPSKDEPDALKNNEESAKTKMGPKEEQTEPVKENKDALTTEAASQEASNKESAPANGSPAKLECSVDRVPNWASACSTPQPGETNGGKEGQQGSESAEEEKEEKDGEDSSGDEETKNSPPDIPRGKFYMHDTREDGGEKDSAPNEAKESLGKSRADRGRWRNDLYDENRQRPKTDRDLVRRYGENIRGDSDAQRRREPAKQVRGRRDAASESKRKAEEEEEEEEDEEKRKKEKDRAGARKGMMWEHGGRVTRAPLVASRVRGKGRPRTVKSGVGSSRTSTTKRVIPYSRRRPVEEEMSDEEEEEEEDENESDTIEDDDKEQVEDHCGRRIQSKGQQSGRGKGVSGYAPLRGHYTAGRPRKESSPPRRSIQERVTRVRQPQQRTHSPVEHHRGAGRGGGQLGGVKQPMGTRSRGNYNDPPSDYYGQPSRAPVERGGRTGERYGGEEGGRRRTARIYEEEDYEPPPRGGGPRYTTSHRNDYHPEDRHMDRPLRSSGSSSSRRYEDQHRAINQQPLYTRGGPQRGGREAQRAGPEFQHERREMGQGGNRRKQPTAAPPQRGQPYRQAEYQPQRGQYASNPSAPSHYSSQQTFTPYTPQQQRAEMANQAPHSQARPYNNNMTGGSNSYQMNYPPLGGVLPQIPPQGQGHTPAASTGRSGASQQARQQPANFQHPRQPTDAVYFDAQQQRSRNPPPTREKRRLQIIPPSQ